MVIVGTMLLILTVNIFMYVNINRITRQMDRIYAENIRLNELEDSLDGLQSSVTAYLNTKSTDSLTDYYNYRQSYLSQLSVLEMRVTDNKLKMMERNIYFMSQDYLGLLAGIVEAKRGRNVEKYKENYEDSEKIYGYIHSYISSLNSYRFRGNTESYSYLSSSLAFLEIFSMGMLVIMAIFDIILVVLVTGNITRPLHELSKAADKVSEGKLDEVGQVKFYSRDEVGSVTVAFNQMVSSIPDYLDRLREGMEKEQLLKEKELMMEANLKDARLKILQAQINPHFLFNTMNAGSQLAMMEHADKTHEYIQNVATFFRYNISQNDEVSLSQEIELVDIYIYILNVRFSGDIHFTKNIEDENLLNVILPSMIIQPIVENSVNYGIRNIEWEGRIELNVNRVDDNVCISISDNGVGMEPEVIESILKGTYINSDKKKITDSTDIEEKKGNGVGLRNVMERLRLYYNDKNDFEIISAGRNQGTEVVITIPLPDEAYNQTLETAKEEE
ncbi:MAG: histidine kinase [Eubacterium sp.]|nr:histidine kinase [Eubacterium sp.]